MAIRSTRPWRPIDAAALEALPGQLGVFELADAAGEVIFIGRADARTLFGLRGEVAARVAALRPVHEAVLPEVAWFQNGLATLGFAVPQTGVLDEPTRRVMAAFQMKYRPARHDGQPDAETAALMQALTQPAAR